MNKKKGIIDFKKYYLLAMFVATLFMCIGYATVNSVTLNFSGSVSAEAFRGVFVSATTILDSNSTSHVDLFYETMMQSTVILEDNKDSTLSMQISVYNNSQEDVYYDNTVYGDNFYDNENIDYTITGISHGDKLAVHATKTFTITFKYTDEYKATNPTIFDNVLNSYLNFRFIKGYSITYTGGFSSTTGLPDLILEDESKTITFTSTTGIPNNVTVSGATGGFISPILTITNPTGNVTITGSFHSSGTETEVTQNPDGSTTTTVTTYDNNGQPVEQSVANEDTSGNTITQVTSYVDGEPVITGYDIDIGDNTSGYIVPSTGIDTGVIAFDGNDFTVTLTAKLTFANCTQTICPLVNISAKNPNVNGVLVYESRSTNQKAYTEGGTSMNSPYNKFRFGKYVNNSATGSDDYNITSKVNSGTNSGRFGYNTNNTNPITLTFKIYSTGGIFTSEIYNSSGTKIAVPHKNVSFDFSDTGSEFDDITVVLGEFTSNTNAHYVHQYEILDFNVTKTLN